MLATIVAIPGVAQTALTTGVPTRGATIGRRVNIVSQPPPSPAERRGSAFQMISPGYIDTLGIRVTKGRSIDEHDTATNMRVAMINEFFAMRFLPGLDPLTQRISVEEFIPGQPGGKPIEWQIVGVFHNTRGAGFREDNPEVYIPFAQSPWPQASMVIRAEGDPKALIKSLAAAVNSVDADLPCAGVVAIE